MELECDLGAIQNEELLRKMWQQSEDSERKKQIRSHLYKLRESRLRNLHSYEPDSIMSEPNGNTLSGYGKDPLATSHGDALLDQNFQSLKSKEVRDSMSPTHELKFHSMSLAQPNTTGWDVQTSSEVSPDGRAYRTETLAKTDGVEKLNGGGVAEFKGRNEQRSSASHQGDDKNFVKKAAESSNTHLQEKVVFGDESSGRTEMKTSSTTSSSTSKFVSSSSSTREINDDEPRYLLDSHQHQQQQQLQQQHQQQREIREREVREREEQRLQEQRFQEQRVQEQRFQEQRHQREQQESEERYSESREQSNSTRNVETKQRYEENKRYVDMDKASPEYQQHVQDLMAQPGEIISNTVEYPKPNVKMITTVKRLPDGTIVKNKRYETEQMSSPSTESVTRQTQNQTQLNNQRRTQDQQTTEQYRQQSHPRGEPRDVVDNAEPVRRPVDAEEVIKQESYSTVKKSSSSRNYSTETTSETVEQQYDESQPQLQPSKAASPTRPDFSTHGFPSAKTTNPIQEFPNQRPFTPRQQTNDFSTHGFPSVRCNKPTQEFLGQRPTTEDEEYIMHKSQTSSRNVKESSTSQRTVETEYMDEQHPPLPVATPSWEQPASLRRPDNDDLRSSPVKPRSDHTDAEWINASRKSHKERIIETQVEQEPEHARRQQPLHTQAPSSPRRTQDYGTHGFPSARSPTRNTPRSPLAKSPPRKPNTTTTAAAGSRTPGRSTATDTTTTTVTRRHLQKEREVDAAHRAFAASLRSSSPAESTGSTGSHNHPRRDSAHSDQQRMTPRSSVSSSRTYRRDGREGSHDSHAPSESSRISSTTVTRHVGVPATKSVGKTLVTKQQQTVVKTRNVQGSNETIDLMPQRSPKSPAHTTKTTTTTTATTIVNKPAAPAETPSSVTPTTPTAPSAPRSVPTETPNVSDNQSLYTYATTKPADIFSLPPTPPTPTINNNNATTTTLTTTTTKNQNQNNPKTDDTNHEMITKTKLSSNEATTAAAAAAVEPPCVRRHYYKLGPSDTDVPTATPTTESAQESASITKAVTSTETVAAASPKSQPHAPRPKSGVPSRTPSSSHRSNHSTVGRSDDEEPTPARRSSKSPSVERRQLQRETTFETRLERDFLPEDLASIDDQIYIDESSLEFEQCHPKGNDKPRNLPSQTLERIPAEFPSKPKESPRQSLEKQLHSKPRESARASSPEKLTATLPRELPRSTSPEKQLPREPIRQSPEKQLLAAVPARPKESPRSSSPDKQQQGTVASSRRIPEKVLPAPILQESPRHSPEKQLPRTASKDLLKNRSTPEKQRPKESSPERQLPSPTKERQLPASKKPMDEPNLTSPEKQQPTQFKEDALFRSTVTQRVTNTMQNLNEEFIANESQSQPEHRKPQDLFEQAKLPETHFPISSKPDDKDMIDRSSDKPATHKTPETSETPDGGFISKSPEPEDQKPTFRKKGLTRRETFEDRCRHILGMEEDGDTQGNYIPKTQDDTDDDTEKKETTTHVKETETFEFKIEDCLDDDEDDKTHTQVTETYIIRTQPVIKVEEPLSEPEGQLPQRSELSLDATETEQISTEKTIDKKTVETCPSIGRQPKDDIEQLSVGGLPEENAKPRPTNARWPKDKVEPRPATPRQHTDESPQLTEPRKYPKDDAEFINVEKDTITTQRSLKTPATKSPSPTRKETLPHPENDEKPRPTSDRRQSKNDVEPLPTNLTETINVNEETTIVITQRPSKSPSPTRNGSVPCPKDETVKQPRTGKPTNDKSGPRPETNRQPMEGKEPRSADGKHPIAQAPTKHPKDDAEYITEETTVLITKRPSKSPSPTRKMPETQHFVTEKVIDCNGKTVVEKISKTQRTTTIGATSEPNVGPKKKQPIDNEPEEIQPKQLNSKKPSSTKIETERRNSRTTKTSITQQPVKESKPHAVKSPRKESVPRREPAKRDSLVDETHTTTTTTTTTRNTTQKDRKPNETCTSPTIKDRLRSSPRKQKPQPDDVDGQSTSPDTSPTRIPSERRRSSNISVTTEIIIDHKTPKTPSPKTERKVTPTKVPISPIRKLPVTERKESAPVPRVTRRDKDKVTRSTSENVIKVVNGKPKPITPEMNTLNPSSAQRSTERSRPSKCFTTKTINLSEQLINSEEMENVIIDIQHAKSSREPSPDRIVPTPVNAMLDTYTGKPRYPDVVQEPEDEPRKKPVITNIPIFEEEANAYVGCQISELRNPNGIDADIHDNPMVEAPQSLEYSTNTPVQPGIDVDECLLSVHEKVSKFTHTADQVKQPKSSTPFSRQFDEHAKVSASDECLLSIDQKVDRFLKTAENITKQSLTTPTREIERPNFEDIDEELRKDDCILSVSQKVHKFIDTAEKLAPSAPQKSPRLVANIERHISRQSEPELEQESEPEQPSDLETEEPVSNDDLLPMTKNHTTAIELKRQKDILSRPSVFGQRTPTATLKHTPNSGKSSTALITEERKSHRNQQSPRNVTSNVSPSSRSPKRKPSLEQPRSKPSDTERSSTNSTTKRRDHITQQQWVICDDVDVEEVKHAPASHSVSPQPTGHSKQTTSSTIKPTIGSTTAPRKPSLEQQRGKPNAKEPSDYHLEKVTRRTTSTSKHRSDVEVDVDETLPIHHGGSPQQMSPGSRTAAKPTTRSNIAPRKPSLEQPRNKLANKEPNDNPTETVTRHTTTSSTTTRSHEQWLPSDVDAPNHSHSGSPQPHRRTPNTATKPNSNSTINSSSTINSNSTVVKASTEHSTTKHTTTRTNRTHSPPTNPILASSPDTEQPHVEPLLERSRPTTTQTTPGRTVASRRNIFEKQSPSPSPSPNPTTESPTGRRPSYMDHTKSSLEHIRRDSIEFNKTHYSRKSSVEDGETEPRNPNAAVKFDVPRRTSRNNEMVVRTTSVSEDTDIDIEAIFELATLEQLLETVTSYELRRRIRAQMRLIKKNMINAGASTTTTSSTTIKSSSSTPSRSPLPPRREQPQPQSQRERSQSPRTTNTTPSTTGHGKPPIKPRERSASPSQTRQRSPTSKSNITTTTTRTTNSSTSNGQSTSERRPSKGSGKTSPIWTDRTKVLRATGSASPTPRKGSTTNTTSSSTTSTSTSGKTTRSSNITSTRTSSSSNSTATNKRREEDSITSSYGVGPTDENGLPLFGIRALKKKTQPMVPCETKQEVTGYIIEEQFYSDDKSPPRHERKELIYSSNPDELVSLSQELKRKSQTDANTKLQRELKLIDAQGQLPDAVDAIEHTTTSKRRGSVKELSEHFIRKESLASNNSTHIQSQADEEETEDSESNDVCSVIEMETPQMRQQSSSTTRTSSSTRSFLNTSGEERIVSGVDDVLERMRNADNVVEPGDSSEDREARALLNKFLGASVIMQGVETMLPAGQRQQQQQQLHKGSNNNNKNNSNSSSSNQAVKTTRISSSSSSSYSSNKAGNTSNISNTGNISSRSSSNNTKNITSSSPVTRTTCDIEEIWDEQLLRQLLEQASTYEERRKIRARLRELMAEREAQNKQQSSTTSERTETKSKDGGAVVTTTTTKVTTRTVSGNAATKNISPLAKFKQLDKAAAQQQAQKSSPTTSTPTTPGGSAQPYFKFTDPALNARAATVKDQLLQWCQHKTQEYENVQISNFSSSWSDGLAFCALIHHFLPDAFDYTTLTKQTRRHNFELAFTVADEKAGIAPLLDVEDMVEMSRPDWKCVFVYVQSIYRRFRNCQ